METVATVAEDRARAALPMGASEGTQGGIVFIGSVSSAGNRGPGFLPPRPKAGLGGTEATTRQGIHLPRHPLQHHPPGYTDTPMVRLWARN